MDWIRRSVTLSNCPQVIGRDYQTRCYAAEEFLPLDAEQMVAAYRVHGKVISTVATEIQYLRETLTELDRLGIPVKAITPIAVGAVESICSERKIKNGWIVAENEFEFGQSDLINVSDQLVNSWQLSALEENAITRTLLLHAEPDNDEPVYFAGNSQNSKIDSELLPNSTRLGKSRTDFFLERCEKYLAQNRHPIFDLNRPELIASETSPFKFISELVVVRYGIVSGCSMRWFLDSQFSISKTDSTRTSISGGDIPACASW